MEQIAISRFITKKFQATEAMKTLRTNLMFSGPQYRVIGLTSFSAAEGKSTVSLQLAASLAQTGKRVLLMDADLRKSVLVNRLRLRSKVLGLSHYLSDQAKKSELINETDVPGLYLMFAGTRVTNAAELLGNEKFATMTKELKKVFDYVIVDAAPVGQVIDCAVMAPALDGILLVIDTTHNSYKLERRIKQQLEMAGAKILGVVLNKVDMEDRGGYYGKAYGYGYGEGYGDVEK